MEKRTAMPTRQTVRGLAASTRGAQRPGGGPFTRFLCREQGGGLHRVSWCRQPMGAAREPELRIRFGGGGGGGCPGASRDHAVVRGWSRAERPAPGKARAGAPSS